MTQFSIETSAFRDCGVKRGGTWMFRASDALRLIAECESQGCPIFGIETFTLSPAVTQPHPDHIADYSSETGMPGLVYAAATGFVRERQGMDFYFEVVLGDSPGE